MADSVENLSHDEEDVMKAMTKPARVIDEEKIFRDIFIKLKDSWNMLAQTEGTYYPNLDYDKSLELIIEQMFKIKSEKDVSKTHGDSDLKDLQLQKKTKFVTLEFSPKNKSTSINLSKGAYMISSIELLGFSNPNSSTSLIRHVTSSSEEESKLGLNKEIITGDNQVKHAVLSMLPYGHKNEENTKLFDIPIDDVMKRQYVHKYARRSKGKGNSVDIEKDIIQNIKLVRRESASPYLFCQVTGQKLIKMMNKLSFDGILREGANFPIANKAGDQNVYTSWAVALVANAYKQFVQTESATVSENEKLELSYEFLNNDLVRGQGGVVAVQLQITIVEELPEPANQK